MEQPAEPVTEPKAEPIPKSEPQPLSQPKPFPKPPSPSESKPSLHPYLIGLAIFLAIVLLAGGIYFLFLSHGPTPPFNNFTGNQNNNSHSQPPPLAGENHTQTAFIAIHMEPSQDARTTSRPEQYWLDLVDLVETADEYDIKLTLMFNPQWATYILANESRLAQVRSWEANGHELAAHHHGPGYGNGWDGYTNEPGYTSDPEYLGNMTDYINLLNQLPASGQVVTGGIANANDKPYDWPEGIIYGAEGITVDNLFSTPEFLEYNGQPSTGLRYAGYELGGSNTLTFATLQREYATSNSDEIMGLVFHEANYAEHPEKYEQLFQFLNEKEIEVRALGSILSGLGY